MASIQRNFVRHLVCHGAALAGILLAFVIREALVAQFGPVPPYLTFYPALMLIALLCGPAAGVLATIVAGLMTVHFILPPQHSWQLSQRADQIAVGFFVVMGCMFSTVAALYQRAKNRGALYEHEKQIRESEVRFRLLLEKVREYAVFMLDAEGRISTWNEGAERLTGWPSAQAMNHSLLAWLSPEGGPRLELPRSVRKEEDTFEGWFTRPDNDRFWASVTLAAARKDSGAVGGYVAILRDLTEHKQVHENLQRAANAAELERNLLEVTLTSMGDGVIVTDVDSRITFMNREAERLTGHEARESQGQQLATIFQVIDQSTGKQIESFGEKVLRLGHTVGWVGESTLVSRNGRQIAINDSGSPVRTADGRVHGLVLVFRDASRQKQIETSLRNSVKRYRDLVELSPEAIFINRNNRIVYINPAGVKLLGARSSEEIVGKSPFDIFHPAYHELIGNRIERLRAGEPVSLMREKVLRLDGGIQIAEVAAAPYEDDEGPAIQVILRDVTEQENMLDKLRRSEAQLLTILENLNEGLVISDVDGMLIRWNRAALEMHGMATQEECLRRLHEFPDTFKLFDLQGRLLPVEDWPLARVLRGEHLRNLDIRIQRVNSDWERYYSYGGSMVHGADHEPMVAFVAMTDITERKKAEEDLRRSTVLLQALSDHTPEPFYAKDYEGRLLWLNPATLRVIGKPIEQVIGHKETDWMENAEQAATIMANDRRIMDSGVSEVVEERVTGPTGTRIYLGTKTPLRDENGRVVGLVGHSRDITERKQIEEELASAKEVAEQASRAKDHFLAVLSHELRTPLTPVLGAVSMLQEDPTLNADKRQVLELMRRNLEMEARLIDDLLDMTHIVKGRLPLQKSPLRLADLVERTAEVCREDLRARSLSLEVDLGSAKDCRIYGDLIRLQQVLWNLLKNAIKFTRVAGHIALRCREENSLAVIEVIDDGEGIDPARIGTIFEAFEQAGQRGNLFGGLGLGLAICKALVEMHDGAITAASSGAGRGATFAVRLPILKAEPVEQKVSDIKPTPAPNILSPCPYRILLVEDQADTAKILKRLLERRGHRIETADTVEGARRALTTGSFDLVLSDLGLPDGSGIDLMRYMREYHPGLKAIALSGYGMDTDIQRSLQTGFSEHLIKPVDIKTLQSTIDRVMTP